MASKSNIQDANSLLILLQKKAEDNGLKPVISVAKFQSLLANMGSSLSTEQIQDMLNSGELSQYVKSSEDNTITLKTFEDKGDEFVDDSSFEDMGEGEEDIDAPLGNEGLPSDESHGEEFNAPNESPQPQSYDMDDDHVPWSENPVGTMAKRAASRAIR